MRRMMQPKAFTDTDHRQHRFLDTLFKALERLGFGIKSEQLSARLFRGPERTGGFSVAREAKTGTSALTEEENHWHWNRDLGWVKELQPTGVLIFSIKTWLADGMRREWKDEPDKPLEQNLPDIIATLTLAGPFLVQQRQERAEAEKRSREDRRQRYLQKRDREQDQKRWQCFLHSRANVIKQQAPGASWRSSKCARTQKTKRLAI